ncbi:MAG: hypothetical protein QM805_22510 [Pseudomonas sp.]
MGRGAGRDATASAVIGDIVDALIAIRDGGAQGLRSEDIRFLEKLGEGVRMARMDEIVGKFYLRLTLADRAGVLATSTASSPRSRSRSPASSSTSTRARAPAPSRSRRTKRANS